MDQWFFRGALFSGWVYGVARFVASLTKLKAVRAAIKQIFTLEDVADGLAYFSVKVKSVSKMTEPAGAPTDTNTTPKGEAIFDLKMGMRVEMTTKTIARIKMDQNSNPMVSLNIHKMTMELK